MNKKIITALIIVGIVIVCGAITYSVTHPAKTTGAPYVGVIVPTQDIAKANQFYKLNKESKYNEIRSGIYVNLLKMLASGNEYSNNTAKNTIDAVSKISDKEIITQLNKKNLTIKDTITHVYRLGSNESTASNPQNIIIHSGQNNYEFSWELNKTI